ncbi:primosomal protein N' [Helicobacter kayseriensis]|uniref:primosomal protein N' n=1 Tax=Helicobacter kayseriensis TaxID=2905877 RepID=UPI001E406DC2|nr:primosomal protein N' [Helicobacter kayseriensis]MCE3047685.1 primosomal protein N' [Helicobacter kayseriensis]
MKYYLIAPLSHSPLLVYSSQMSLQKGEIVHIKLKNHDQKGVVWEECEKPNFSCKEAQSLNLFLLPHQILLAHFIAQYYCTSLGKSLNLFVPTPSPIAPHPQALSFSNPLTLSSHQKQALNFLSKHPLSLLFGETGSGKSEVYIQLIIQTLQNKQSALLLMPEISLTPQMQQRLERVFGSCVGIWHSKMSQKKKQEILAKIESQEVRLILGARSALFLPIPHLGIIIVDEEHDDAYKAQSSPRYNARDLAIYLGKKQNIRILLGSATPSATSYFLTLPLQSIFKLKKHFPSHNHLIFLKQKTELSATILEHIHTTLLQKKQVIIFLPTRANFKYLLCLSCGEGVKCPFCSISMSLHRNKNMMLCHYCGFSQQIPSVCPNCQSPHFQSHRIGTVQVAEELQDHFPHSKLAIFDRDHIQTQAKLEKILQDFAQEKIDILVGTQMLSKGHDYHNIGLAIILGIDEILHFGDFRSREKAMSLFFQIKGRVGRKNDGITLIQTLNPSFFDFQDYEKFLEDELYFRQDLYPPFMRLATITFSHTNAQKAQNQMLQTLEILKNFPHIQVVGGGKARIEKINSKYRYMILLRSNHPKPLLLALHSLPKECEIDIDPLNIV